MEGERGLCPFRYPGQYEDAETGLYYNRFRYFDPEAGGYISQDPIRLEGGNPTLYGYVGDPNGWVDWLGLACSPSITPDELRGKSRSEIARLANQKGLIPSGAPDPISGKPRKWKDPLTGKERIRLDRGHTDPTTGLPYNNPRAARDHVHGYEPDGTTKIRDPLAGNDAHFPTTGE